MGSNGCPEGRHTVLWGTIKRTRDFVLYWVQPNILQSIKSLPPQCSAPTPSDPGWASATPQIYSSCHSVPTDFQSLIQQRIVGNQTSIVSMLCYIEHWNEKCFLLLVITLQILWYSLAEESIFATLPWVPEKFIISSLTLWTANLLMPLRRSSLPERLKSPKYVWARHLIRSSSIPPAVVTITST